MYDTALDSFIDRFGEIEKPDSLVGTTGNSNLKIGASGVGEASKLPLSIGANGIAETKPVKNAIGADGVMAGGITTKASGEGRMDQMIAGGGMSDAISGGMGLVQSWSGSGMNTDADSGGPGKAGGHILQGAAAGMQAGSVAGPWGMAIGAAVGGAGSAIAHGQAKKEYYENVVKENKKDFEQGQNELREDYRMSRGLASIADSKALLEKQLNVIS